MFFLNFISCLLSYHTQFNTCELLDLQHTNDLNVGFHMAKLQLYNLWTKIFFLVERLTKKIAQRNQIYLKDKKKVAFIFHKRCQSGILESWSIVLNYTCHGLTDMDHSYHIFNLPPAIIIYFTLIKWTGPPSNQATLWVFRLL